MGKRRRGEVKGAQCSQSLMMIKLHIKKSCLCRKQILKYYIALRQRIYKVCVSAYDANRQIFRKYGVLSRIITSDATVTYFSC